MEHAKWEENRAQHLTALKDKLKLKLKPEHVVAWNAFAQASQPSMHAKGADKQAMRGEFEKLTTPQRMDKMLAMSDRRRARMVERTQAVKTFYAQLNPQQQSVFDAEAMHTGHRGHGHPRG
ncbi:Spy/CpxP family protein refolding chaperone [Sulfuriferula sp.]|uniref:Spy/CpxP family protein refolding chaperone n=1 Tax=Sulfuriferula sp. TaxID=2025307 RepID=UPI0027307BE1|nr:Spy/CpxP family protein refolding chaperone [Sulfuriferula sp.]MDP2026198.1 Spy/CpxP family protein refolding chaperone [Sulfuriferula sp.]